MKALGFKMKSMMLGAFLIITCLFGTLVMHLPNAAQARPETGALDTYMRWFPTTSRHQVSRDEESKEAMERSNGDMVKIDEDAWWREIANSIPPPFLSPAIAADPLSADKELDQGTTTKTMSENPKP